MHDNIYDISIQMHLWYTVSILLRVYTAQMKVAKSIAQIVCFISIFRLYLCIYDTAGMKRSY